MSLRLVLMFFLISLLNTEAFAKAEKYRIWYIPLDVNYYAPMTKEEIENRATVKVTKSSPKIDDLFLEAAKKKKYEGLKPGNDLRVKFQRLRDGVDLFINRDKSVVFDGQLVTVPEEVVFDVLKLLDKKNK